MVFVPSTGLFEALQSLPARVIFSSVSHIPGEIIASRSMPRQSFENQNLRHSQKNRGTPPLPAPQSDNDETTTTTTTDQEEIQFYSDSGSMYYLDEELSDPGLVAFYLVTAEMLDSVMIEWEMIFQHCVVRDLLRVDWLGVNYWLGVDWLSVQHCFVRHALGNEALSVDALGDKNYDES
jgi:hypothetical protein